MAIPISRTNTIAGELHQIRAYVESANARLQYLEGLIEQSPTMQLSTIRNGLLKALLSLEKMQAEASPAKDALGDAAEEAGKAYTRLRILEERVRDVDEERPSQPEAVAYYQPRRNDPVTERFGENRALRALNEQCHPRYEESPRRREASTAEREPVLTVEEKCMMTGALPAPQSEDSIDSSTGARKHSCRAGTRRESSDEAFDDREGVVTTADSILVYRKHRKELKLPDGYIRSRAQIMASLLEEDFYTSATSMREPDTARKGSTTGWICTQEIMCGIDDVRCVRPQLAFFKVHEVKELKNWLAGHRYLERSDGISRVEKLLHLIFLLQDGVRFEVIAVLFSRSPNTVKRSCLEVFNGLLEMHSETMVPEDPPLYCHLWRITDQYATADRCMSAYRYYPWDAHDLSKVLTTMNFYIGRYRKQAKLALDGPFMDWGRYLRGSSRYLQGSSSSSNNGV